jgi:hypothetical protein
MSSNVKNILYTALIAAATIWALNQNATTRKLINGA